MKPWIEIWQHNAGLPPGTPEWLTAIIGLVCIYLLVILPSGVIIAFLDRKLSADFQARIGPNRAGPAGILQPVADMLKLLQKQAPKGHDWRQAAWLGVQTMALYSTVAVLPIGSATLMLDTDMSAFLPFWAALVTALISMLLGLSQSTLPGWFGGIRVAAQAMAGAFPALICIICAGVHAGGFSWQSLVSVQGSSPLHWTVFSNPFQVIAFIVFVGSGMVLLSVPPLDGAYSLPDIHGGVISLLQGRRLSLFQMGRFYAFFLWTVVTTVIFLGGWNLPDVVTSALQESDSWRILEVLQLVVLLAKTYLLMLIVVWLARANPRPRTDQITDFSWKVLGPLSLLALAGTAFWAGWAILR